MPSPPSAPPPRRRSGRVARVAVISLIAGLLAALTLTVTELALRTSHASSIYREVRKYPPHPFLQATPVMAAGDVNPQGFRGDPITRAKPPLTFRVFTIGGSTTLGVNNDYRDSYPFLLQAQLRERYPGVNIEVQNAGCAWYTSAHALVSYQIFVREYEPHLVIFFEAINDMVRSFAPPWLSVGEFKEDYSHYLGPYARMLGPDAGYSAPLSSWLTVNVVRRRMGADPDPFNIRNRDNVARLAGRLREVDDPPFRSLASYRRFYDTVIHTVQSDGHTIFTASQPSIYRADLSPEERRLLWFAPLLSADDGTYPSLAAMERGMAMYNAAAREIAGARGVPFLDFAAAVPKTPAHFIDDVHMTSRANAILAEMVADRIEAAGLVPAALRGASPPGALLADPHLENEINAAGRQG